MKKPIIKAAILFGLAILSAIIHNIIYGIFEFEEPIFFILTFAFGVWLVIHIIRSLIVYFRKNKEQS